MTTIPRSRPWDFSHVLDLVNALSPQSIDEASKPDYVSAKSTKTDQNGVATKDFAQGVNLGDFGRIWQALGVPEQKENREHAFASKADYTSDGAISYGTSKKKKVTWKEHTSADELATETECEAATTPTPSGESLKLNKNQRKKQNRKARKAREAGTVSESEADIASITTPARRASNHAGISSPQTKLISRTRSGGELRTLVGQAAVMQHDATPSASRPDITVRQNSEPAKSAQISTISQPPQWPVAATPTSNNIAFLPASVPPKSGPSWGSAKAQPLSDAAAAAVRALQNAQANLNGNRTPQTATKPSRPATLPRRQTAIEPKIVRSGEDRNWALLLKLINEYPETRKHLVAPMNMTTHNNDPKGIHIFVDASNIFIGFNDQLKRARNIPIMAKVPPVDLSFDALALLMERRRPVAKRVLVGSTPHLPAFDKAKAVGYECSILEKVYKAKELTDRQIFFRDAEKHKRRAKAGLPSTSPSNGFLSTDEYSGAGSGSETNTGPQYAPAKMIEQGVDEILHLKILESIVDSDQAATMVIATGDAAQAEYSDGFMAMTLRALKKGWRVELVSWSKNISTLYLRQSFRDVWGDNFRIIFLDDYAEELLDM